MNFSIKRVAVSAGVGAVSWFVLMVLARNLFYSYGLYYHGLLFWLIFSGIAFYTLPASVGSGHAGIGNAGLSKGDAPLTITQDGEWTVIHARPVDIGGYAAFGWVFGAIFGGVAGAAVASFMHMMSGGNWPVVFLVIFVVLTFLIAKGYVALINRHRKVQRAPFAVSATGVRLPSGREVARANVYAWTVRNARNGQVFIAANSYAIAGQIMAQNLAEKSYVLELEHDGKATVVAGGLSSALAQAARDEAKARGDELAERSGSQAGRHIKGWLKAEDEESDRKIATSGEKASAALHRLADEADIQAERWSRLRRNVEGEVIEAIVADRTGRALVIYNDGQERWTGNLKGAQLFPVEKGLKAQVDDPDYRAKHLAERRFHLSPHQPSHEWEEWVDRIRMLSAG